MPSAESDLSTWGKSSSVSRLWTKKSLTCSKTSPKSKTSIHSTETSSTYSMTRTITNWPWVTSKPPKTWLITWAKIIWNWSNMLIPFTGAKVWKEQLWVEFAQWLEKLDLHYLIWSKSENIWAVFLQSTLTKEQFYSLGTQMLANHHLLMP